MGNNVSFSDQEKWEKGEETRYTSSIIAKQVLVGARKAESPF
ncbi:hypothetical protein [Thermus sediminis]|nr:hypothetical protein [Thermus sediminis]